MTKLIFVCISTTIQTSQESTHFLFQDEQQQANLERVTVQLNNARTYAAGLRNIIGQFRAIVEELVGQEDNLQIVSCILLLILFMGYYCNFSARQADILLSPAKCLLLACSQSANA